MRADPCEVGSGIAMRAAAPCAMASHAVCEAHGGSRRPGPPRLQGAARMRYVRTAPPCELAH
eukprot:450649-Pyramimonas_sp.AAC.1